MSFFNKILLKLNLIHKKILSKKNYFSFSGVDILIENIFRNQKKGFYIDVGCQHPIKNNNTYLLHKRGWSGINIDLDKDNIDLFNFSRISDDNINIAASNKINEVDLFFFHKKSPINTIDKKTSQFQKAKISSIKKIKTNTLNNIIKSSKYSNRKIDLLSIDVEGHELPVLEGLDFDKYSPNVIVVEYLDLNVSKLEIKNLNIENVINSEIYKFLTLKKYILVNSIYSDLIFIKSDFRD
jgi:FkbM family methyltransferase